MTIFFYWYIWGWVNLLAYCRRYPRNIFLSELLGIFIGMGEKRLMNIIDRIYCRFIKWNPVMWESTIYE